MHTGLTGDVTRNHGGDSPANWLGNNSDLFPDEPSNPFGTSIAGTGTLSVNATYTVGFLALERNLEWRGTPGHA